MAAVIFLGPSLPVETAREYLDAVYLPPAAQGDVYRVCAERPEAIGIIDGRFQDVPAVWHKEILWALSQRIPVLGASSMGALRAAELDRFGMRGVGRIYCAYRDGETEDDDEVAVAHLDADSGFAPLSEPMIDIRFTLRAAAAADVITADQCSLLIAGAKAMFYPQRTYPAVLRYARDEGLGDDRTTALEQWLHAHRVRQKQADAIELLSLVASGVTASTVPFTFEHTQFFERARRSAGAATKPLLASANSGADADETNALAEVTLERLLDELRLNPQQYRDVRTRAVTRCLAVRDAARQRSGAIRRDLQLTVDQFRAQRSLLQPQDTTSWMAANQVTLAQLAALAAEDADVDEVGRRLDGDLDIYLRNELRSSGHYAELARRAHEKYRTLRQAGADDASEAGVSDEDAFAWYLEHTGQSAPKDMHELIRGLGYADPVTFLRAVKREYLFVALRAEPVIAR